MLTLVRREVWRTHPQFWHRRRGSAPFAATSNFDVSWIGNYCRDHLNISQFWLSTRWIQTVESPSIARTHFHIIAGASYKSWANFHRVLTSMLELLDMVPIKCEVIFHDTWIRFVLCIIIAHNDGPIYRDCIRISIRNWPLECALNSCMCNFMIGANI